MRREQEILNLLNRISEEDLVITSNGKIGRELFEARKKRKEPNDDFIMAGSMGGAIGIGYGVALNTDKHVYVLTGDGALLMKLGSLATIGEKLDNLHIVVFNNESYDSTGGQPTDFKEVKWFVKQYCQVIDVEKGAREDLGRPDITPEQIAKNFYEKVKRIYN